MQQNRAPLETYEQAVFRLVQHMVSEVIEPAALDLAIEVVADIFWLNDRKVRADVDKAARGLGFHSSQIPAGSGRRRAM